MRLAGLALLVLQGCDGLALVPRRSVGKLLGTVAVASGSASVARAADEAPPAPMFVTVKLPGGGTVSMPESWDYSGQPGAPLVVKDKAFGGVTDELVAERTPSTLSSIKDLGKIDTFKMDALRLGTARERGDVLGARVRTDAGGVVYYEWDLIVAPLDCPESQQLTRTTCLPDEVVLVSACVQGGQLVVLHTVTSQTQWKSFGKALRTVRTSFDAAA
ncbi:hypothetical protein M885DRAFT_525556 [Pelagophyceae sp. CCMP2097]|nr:hypothetical protein M885DRAFT_525556 [Pelagophyceae sp. CCMP2097]